MIKKKEKMLKVNELFSGIGAFRHALQVLDVPYEIKVCSNTQLYKQAGNSIVVPVIQAILRSCFKGSEKMDLETLNKANEMHEKIMTLEFALRDMKEAIKKDRHWTIRVFCKEATIGYKLEDELKKQVMEMLENRLKELKQELEEM